MSLWQGFLKGIEYKGAIEAAIDSYNAGDSLPEIVRSFSAETEGTLDDKWAHQVSEALNVVVSNAALIAGKVYLFSSMVETHTPSILKFIETASQEIMETVVPFLGTVDTWTSENSRTLVDVANRVGVIAVEVQIRAERLARPVK